jgi:hypothetical protein
VACRAQPSKKIYYKSICVGELISRKKAPLLLERPRVYDPMVVEEIDASNTEYKLAARAIEIKKVKIRKTPIF